MGVLSRDGKWPLMQFKYSGSGSPGWSLTPPLGPAMANAALQTASLHYCFGEPQS